MSNVKKIVSKAAGVCTFIIVIYFLAKNKEAINHHKKLTTGEEVSFGFLLAAATVLGTLLCCIDFDSLYGRKDSKKEDKSHRPFEYKTETDKLNVNVSKQNNYSTFCPIDKKEDKELFIDVPQENTHSEKSLTIEIPKFDSNTNEKNNLIQEINVVCADLNAQQANDKIHHV